MQQRIWCRGPSPSVSTGRPLHTLVSDTLLDRTPNSCGFGLVAAHGDRCSPKIRRRESQHRELWGQSPCATQTPNPPSMPPGSGWDRTGGPDKPCNTHTHTQESWRRPGHFCLSTRCTTASPRDQTDRPLQDPVDAATSSAIRKEAVSCEQHMVVTTSVVQGSSRELFQRRALGEVSDSARRETPGPWLMKARDGKPHSRTAVMLRTAM